jgi:hypothetical protein
MTRVGWQRHSKKKMRSNWHFRFQISSVRFPVESTISKMGMSYKAYSPGSYTDVSPYPMLRLTAYTNAKRRVQLPSN